MMPVWTVVLISHSQRVRTRQPWDSRAARMRWARVLLTFLPPLMLPSTQMLRRDRLAWQGGASVEGH